MLKKLILFFSFLFFASPQIALASDYKITSFHSDIILEQNTSLNVTENISVYFNVPKHGIFREIDTRGIEISEVKVSDENGSIIPSLVKKTSNSINIKIGDPNKTLTGKHIYNINYFVSNVLREFDGYWEIYWNVTGSDWDVLIPNPSVSLTSNYANIFDGVCFPSEADRGDGCEVSFEKTALISSSKISSGNGQDFTIAVKLDKINSLVFPGLIEKLLRNIKNNLIYLLAFAPLIFMALNWYKKGRDITFGNKVYYGDKKDLKIKPIWGRVHIPTVYTPINGLTPAQIGTLVDELVDIHDIVAEIVELARLGFLKITSMPKKRFGSQDYKIQKLKSANDSLLDYQKYLIESLFPIGSANEIKTSEFKKIKFYKYLPNLKKKIYKSVTDLKLFDGNPENVRAKWAVVNTIIVAATSVLIFKNSYLEEKPILIIFLGVSIGFSYFISFLMPRKSAKGFALYTQVKGLKNYLKIGKWRHEIYEKNLFLEEMIPIAISLGIIKKLSSQMRDLGIKPEKISNNFIVSNNFSSFEKSMTSAFMAGAPKSSSSGFSGGSSGGGFGGGGGGSW